MNILILSAFIGLIAIAFITHCVNKHNLFEKYMTKNTPAHLRCAISPKISQEGTVYLADRKVIICGLMRDNIGNIDLVRANTVKLGSMFRDYKVLIVENDSIDGTRDALQEWKKKDPRITILGCGINKSTCHMKFPKTIGHPKNSIRILKMVTIRNIYMDYIAQNKDLFKGYEFVVVWDMDIKGTFYLDGIGHSGSIFKHQPQVNMLCSNGISIINYGPMIFHTYADPYAHGDFGDKDLDEVGMKRTSQNLWVNWPEQCSSGKNDLVKVASCFNGFAMYRRSAIEDKKYLLVEGKDYPLCEHRTLHSQMEGIYLNPKLIFSILENN